MPLSPRSPNHVLASIPSEIFERFRPHLRHVPLVLGDVLVQADVPLTNIYFPHDSMISLVVRLSEGGTVEAGMVGRLSVFGSAAALDGGAILNEAIVQQAGTASTLEIGHLRAAAEGNSAFRSMLMRHEQVILLQAQQSVACNAFHTAEARLSRWLLQLSDLMDRHDFQLTQEFLGQMIGVRRNSVSLVANTLQRAGLIRYSRGHVTIVNVEGLKECACECYGTIKARYERLQKTDREAALCERPGATA